MGFINIVIGNWDKFNPRTDSKSHSWFRFENSFFTKTFSWTAEEQRLFQYLCCVCSQEKQSETKVDLELASALLKRKTTQIEADLKSLEARGVVTLSNIELLEVTQSSLVPTNVRTNVTNERTETFDFDKIYKEYPLKLGKKDGFKICRREIVTQDLYDRLSAAVIKYRDHCAKQRTEPKFIKHFSTFMNKWTDWDSPESGKVQVSKPAQQPTFISPPELDKPFPASDPGKIKSLISDMRSKMNANEPGGAA